MIPSDIIYLVSEYNCDYKDSFKLSLINKGIYDNSDKIYLNNPIVTYKNYETIIRYNFNELILGNNFIIMDINKIYRKRNIYILDDSNYHLKYLPKNIKKLIIDLTENIGEIRLERLTDLETIIVKNIHNKITLPNNLKKLTFDDYFNRPIILPNNLTHLTFGNRFNQPIILPNSLTHLTFGAYFDQSIDLPNSLTRLIFGRGFNQPINLPNSLIQLTFEERSHFNQPITLPNSLTHLTFGYNFNKPITLPNSLTHLTFGSHFNQPITLSNNLTHLTFGHSFNQPIILPNSLIHLTFGDFFNQPIILPNSLTHLTFEGLFNQPITLPNSLEYLVLNNEYKSSITVHKNRSKELTIRLNYKRINKIFSIESNLEKIIFINYQGERVYIK